MTLQISNKSCAIIITQKGNLTGLDMAETTQMHRHRHRQCVLPSFQACVYGIPFTQQKKMLHGDICCVLVACRFQ